MFQCGVSNLPTPVHVCVVCSTTLWVGQVDKKANQQDLTNVFEEFGQIESINVRTTSLSDSFTVSLSLSPSLFAPLYNSDLSLTAWTSGKY